MSRGGLELSNIFVRFTPAVVQAIWWCFRTVFTIEKEEEPLISSFITYILLIQECIKGLIKHLNPGPTEKKKKKRKV